MAAPSAGRARTVIHVAAATSSFLLAYAALTLCHAAGRDPQVIVRLARIPLFARMLGSALAGATGGMLAPRFVHDRPRALRVIPGLLGATIVLAMIVIVWFA